MNATELSDLARIKQGARATWAAGDFPAIARLTLWDIGPRIVEAAGVSPGDEVLDVGCGTGNAAIRAAQAGGHVTGVDLTPELFDAGRREAAAAGARLEWVQGDAEELPFTDESFDVVLSTFGAMFSPDHRRTAGQLLRVTKPGGRIGLANWTPDGFIGQLFKVIAKHVPPPAGLRSPILWGTEARLQELFGDSIVELRAVKRFYTFRARTPEAWIEDWKRWYGPTLKAFQAVGDAGAPALHADLLELIARFNRATDGTMAVPSEYLETVIVRR